MTPTDEARLEAIARALCAEDHFHDLQYFDDKLSEDQSDHYREVVSRLIAADPLTAEHAQLKADVVEALGVMAIWLLRNCHDRKRVSARESWDDQKAFAHYKDIYALLDRLRGVPAAPKHDCNDGGSDHCWKCR